MMRSILLLGSFLIACSTAHAQFVVTDSMNLGEDRSSHNYMEYGTSISMGNYDCTGDSAITIGANSEGDSIVFELSVTPNTDEIKINWNYAWFNAGSNKDEFIRMVVENEFEAAMESPGPNAIGSHPVSCSLDSHELVFTGVAAHTADGLVKVKIYDPYPAFNGNASICKVIIASDTPPNNTGVSSAAFNSDLKVYPNPFLSQLGIQSSLINLKELNVQLVDVLGKQHAVTIQLQTEHEIVINTDHLSAGIYHLNLLDRTSGEFKWSKKVIKR